MGRLKPRMQIINESDRKNNSRRKDIQKICRLIEERSFTTRMCKNFWRNATSNIILRIPSVIKRTLKNDTWKQFTHNENYKWIDILSRLISNYIARKHQIIDIWYISSYWHNPRDRPQILNCVYNRIKIATIQNGWFGTCEQIQDSIW